MRKTLGALRSRACRSRQCCGRHVSLMAGLLQTPEGAQRTPPAPGASRCSPRPPPPLPGAKVFKWSQPSYRPIWRSWWAPQVPENFGAPFERVGKTRHPILKMLSFFLPFSLDPQEGRICVATSHFVATLIFSRWGQMSTVEQTC